MAFNEILIKNNVYDERMNRENIAPVLSPKYETQQGSLLERLHNYGSDIQEKAFGDISSFNFSRDVFWKGEWNEMTVKARGLFLNNRTGKIVARGFEKFFAYKERGHNTDEWLKENLKYPVDCYVKYNGFLGLLGFDDKGLLFCTKSNIGGEFSQWFERLFHIDDHREQDLLEYMRACNVGFVFEVIDHVNDPHIVEYDHDDIVLLDCIKLDEDFKDVGYDGLVSLAEQFNFHVKEKACSFNDWDSLHEFLERQNSDMDTRQEGFVLVDASNYHFKLKGAWYKFWKWMRTLKDKVCKPGRQLNVSGLDAKALDVIGWMRRAHDTEYLQSHSIIELRNEYEGERNSVHQE